MKNKKEKNNAIKKTARIITTMILCCVCTKSAEAFVHPGCLSTQADMDRMAAKVAACEQPWKGSWDILVANWHAQTSYNPNPQTTVCAGSGCTENYMALANDCAAAYQCALRYHISGNTAYADKAVQIMNAWASTMTGWAGDTNVSLRAGLYGYQMACAGELMRNYSGWNSTDFAAFQTWMIDIFYSKNTYYLTYHHDTVDSHYWANWELANVASVMAIGVLCDDQAIFDEGLNYFYSGVGNGRIDNAVHYIHPDGMGQWQESGRDQGHTVIGPPLMGTICEIAWNQRIDLYGYMGNRFLAGCEYIAKYNLWYDVPFVIYIREYRHPYDATYEVHTNISSGSRGQVRPGWDMIYNHYVNRLGMATHYSKEFADNIRPEGGGGDYGTTSGGYDQLGFTTLTHSLDPIASGAAPSDLLPYIKGRQITLSWAGSAYATSYNVKRSTTSGGPYTTIAIVGTTDTYYIDSGLTAGTTYYYVVSANNRGSESVNSAQVAAIADGQLYGTVIGTDGSWSSKGATKYTVFDGSLSNFFDGPDSVSWAGLDMGSGVSAVITEIRYCPRKDYGGRMVGGRFQGSNTADFSSGVTDLFTINSGPAENVLTSRTISNPGSFRYVRYLSPSGGYGNVAEVQFLGNVSGLSAPTTPTGLSADAINSSQVYLQWNASSGAISYYLKRSTTRGGPYTIIANGNFTDYTDTGLTEGETYYYVVSALNSEGQSGNSNEVSPRLPLPILVAYYPLDDNYNDITGNGYDASAVGSPTLTTGRIEQAVSVSGGSYLDCANSADLMLYYGGTVTAWVKTSSLTNPWASVVAKGINAWRLIRNNTTSAVSFHFDAPDNREYQANGDTTVVNNAWHHLAATYDGVSIKLYVDGYLDSSGTAGVVNKNSDPVYIGSRSDNPTGRYWDGLIDDVRIYYYALSSDDIATLAEGNADNPPTFISNPFTNDEEAIEGSSYSGLPLDNYAYDLEGDTLTFSKISGPAWLSVASDGSISGTPSDSDVGENMFTVQVQDEAGLFDTADMTIDVANIYSGVRGMEDLAGLVAQWLTFDCMDIPACDGADLNGDTNVDMLDLAELGRNWQTGI